MIHPDPEFATPQEALAHFGVLGMKWGVRKEKPPAPTYSSTVDGKALGSPITNMDNKVHTHTQDAAYQVSALLKDRYGYEVTSIQSIEQTRSNKRLIAYVEANGGNKGTIFVQPHDQNPELKKLEEKGWFGPQCGNIRATMTHETAHSMFHAEQTTEGFLNMKVVGGEHVARKTAFDAARKAAKEDGIRSWNFTKEISGYANASVWREEIEAEMFSRYHWSENNPRFIDVWGQTLHKELGLDDTPFRKAVDNG